MLKVEMSSFDIVVVTVELNHMLIDFKINNIYQLNPKTLLLKLRGREGVRSDLLIEAGRRIHLTSYQFEKPVHPPNFCMALRKYLRNGTITSVQQYGFERIVELFIIRKGEEYRLVVELFGNGNIVLVDPSNKILHALSYRRMRDRNIVRGEPYVYPPSIGEDPTKLQRADLDKLKEYGQLEVVKALSRFLSIGGLYAEELLIRADVPKDTACASLSNVELDAIFDNLNKLLSEITGSNLKTYVYIDEAGRWVDVAPVCLRKYSDFKRVQFSSFNEALDEYYAKAFVVKKTTDVKDTADQEASRLERILREQETVLHESKKKAEVYRKIGAAIYSHLNELQLLTQRIMTEKRNGKSWNEIVENLKAEKQESRSPAVYFQALKPKALSVQVSVDGQTFDLDLKAPVQKTASKYYVKAKREERKVKGAQEAVKKTREQIEKARLQGIKKVEHVSAPPPKTRKREWYEKFRWFHSSDGLLVIGGRDATTNEIIIKRHMEPHDVVFHAEITGAPFVLVKTKGKEVPDRTMQEAAQFAASYSRAWREGLGALDVYWVRPEQVSKTPPSGEYLSRGAFMIRGSKNYVKGVPLEVAVGIRTGDEHVNVVGGPSNAISSQTQIYVKIVPGRESSGKLAKQVRSKLARLAPEDMRQKILNIRLEEIQRFIPAGGGTIKK